MKAAELMPHAPPSVAGVGQSATMLAPVPFTHVIVPVDGSALSERAVPVALSIAHKAGATLDLVCVAEPARGEWNLSEGDVREYDEWMRGYVAQLTERCTDRLGAPACGTVLAGAAAAVEVMRRAAQKDADLVVMSSHGRGGLSRAWLGSTTEQMIRFSGRPVLVVRGGDEPVIDQEPTFARVLVPLDGSERAEAILDLATGVADLYDGEVVLARVIETPAVTASLYLPNVAREYRRVFDSELRQAEVYLETVAERLRTRGATVITAVRTAARAADGLLHLVKDVDADMIVMSTHGRTGMPRMLLGSVADKVLRGADVPVLVHRAKD